MQFQPMIDHNHNKNPNINRNINYNQTPKNYVNNNYVNTNIQSSQQTYKSSPQQIQNRANHPQSPPNIKVYTNSSPRQHAKPAKVVQNTGGYPEVTSSPKVQLSNHRHPTLFVYTIKVHNKNTDSNSKE